MNKPELLDLTIKITIKITDDLVGTPGDELEDLAYEQLKKISEVIESNNFYIVETEKIWS